MVYQAVQSSWTRLSKIYQYSNSKCPALLRLGISSNVSISVPGIVRYCQRVWSIETPSTCGIPRPPHTIDSFNLHLALPQLRLDDFLLTSSPIRRQQYQLLSPAMRIRLTHTLYWPFFLCRSPQAPSICSPRQFSSSRLLPAMATSKSREAMLMFDFDGTITVKDTIGVLAAGAIDWQRTKRGREYSATWDAVVQAYLDDLKRFQASYDPPEYQRKSLAREMQYLNAVKPVEHASLARVAESLVFEGLEERDLMDIGVAARKSERVTVRNGFADLLNMARERGWPVGILSVNWSSSFIRGVLRDLDPDRTIRIYANEIAADGKIQGPQTYEDRGRGPLVDAAGKLDFCKDGDYIYFGDSATDLACLVEHKGVVICDDPSTSSLMATLSRLEDAVTPQHVKDPAVDFQGVDSEFLFWARDFREVIDSGALEQAT